MAGVSQLGHQQTEPSLTHADPLAAAIDGLCRVDGFAELRWNCSRSRPTPLIRPEKT